MINRAKEDGDLETLEEIAPDPEAYASKKGLGSLDLSDRNEAESLKRLWHALQTEIISVLEAIEALKGSSEYELSKLAEKNDELNNVIKKREVSLQKEYDLNQRTKILMKRLKT